MIPSDYAHAALTRDLFFWTEAVLLHTYLADNPRLEIKFGCAIAHDRALDREIIPTSTGRCARSGD